jgi:hypothetical protein
MNVLWRRPGLRAELLEFAQFFETDIDCLFGLAPIGRTRDLIISWRALNLSLSLFILIILIIIIKLNLILHAP